MSVGGSALKNTDNALMLKRRRKGGGVDIGPLDRLRLGSVARVDSIA